ncbi:hypothetical protein IP81_19175 [Novosphingobium sp. AAP83]|uniref:hypothetical protein n=1 Tax=Novosphingobium sp. AAP83 TaxID=1523425 RepID=UPI0006B9EA3A|nr:hypothetical protein [Novosphingobium sp. AAP83]KPF86970.1 hypothetical protein IP81_19175 [Novosphingobium sp. AAP83]
MNAWHAWIGREEVRQDSLEAALVQRWCATLDREVPEGGTVPQGLHWCLCVPDAPTARLGDDGHPARDDSLESFLPPLSLPRRMWAASAVEFLAPLRIGAAIKRVSRVKSITPKQGGTGPLVFAEVEHETSCGGVLAVREAQSLVYREASAQGGALAPPPPGAGRFDTSGWDATREVLPSEPLLFRYSALTFNSHRIHYDGAYATGVEGYRGLVVHGPLVASLLLDLARRELGEQALASFAFRGVSPAICGEALHLAMRQSEGGLELGAFASDGRPVMSASARA